MDKKKFTQNTVMLLCMIITISLLLSYFFSKILNKKIDNVAAEAVATLSSMIILIILSIKMFSQKELHKDKHFWGKTKKIKEELPPFDSSKTKTVFPCYEKCALHLDFLGTVTCCVIQLTTLITAINPISSQKNTLLSLSNKVTNLIGMMYSCIAAGLILANRSQEYQNNKKENKVQKDKLILASLMLTGITMSLLGKALSSFVQTQNSVDIALLTRIVGSVIFTAAFFCDVFHQPKQKISLTKNRKENINELIKQSNKHQI